MALRCPGRTANVLVESTLVPCPECGRTVEIFGDEERVHCRCGHWVFREALPSCAQWCPEAERCFGSAGNPARLSKTADQKEQEERFRELQERIATALANCPQPQVKQRKGP